MSFTEISCTPLPDHNAKGRHFVHKKYGTLVYHVQNDDKENLFAFTFKTPPENSRGVAHILEHTVLCGSERFQVKDPFAQLRKGSMHTFLNASTYPDRTVYPAASAVKKDLFNIMKVYGDAVFFPLLKKEMFLQEGYRIEFHEKKPSAIQGIVYNEMMGNMSSKEYLSAEYAFSSMFETGTYSHNSGGDPDHIPQMSYEEFLAFHRKYYCPANCGIFLYGDIPSETYLEFMEEEIFSRLHEKGHPVSLPQSTPRWESPRSFRVAYPVPHTHAQKDSVIISWLLFPVSQITDTLTMHIVSELLIGNKASPLYKALIESELGESLSSTSGLELDIYEALFSVGLDGMQPAQEQAIESLVLQTLAKISKEGFPEEQIEAVLRKIEFFTREVEGGARNGLRLLYRFNRAWSYDGSFDKIFHLSTVLQELRSTLGKDPHYLNSFIASHLLQNTHRATLTAYPDADVASRKEAIQKRYLRDILASNKITEHAEDSAAFVRMQESQESPAALARIPRLKRSDIPTKVREFSSELRHIGKSVPLMTHSLFTNNIAYLTLAFDITGIDDALLDQLPLFSEALLECGLKSMSYEELANEIDLHTGGISAYLDTIALKEDPTRIRPLCYLHLSFAQEHSHRAIHLLFRILREVDFFQLAQLRRSHFEQLHYHAAELARSGHRFAYYRASRNISPVSALSERWNGLDQLQFLHDLQSSDYQDTATSLSTLAKELFVQNRLTLNLVCHPTQEKDILPVLEQCLTSLDLGKTARSISGYVPPRTAYPPHESILIANSVAYNAIAFPSIPILSKDYPSQRVLSHLLDGDYLWDAIRTRGGAYGFGTIDRAYEGIMIMFSYRDPHIACTFQAFKDSLAHFAEHPCSPQDIDLALFHIIGREERTIVPQEQGSLQFHRYIQHITTEFRQTLRDALLRVGPEDIQNTAKILKENISHGHMATVTNEALLKHRGEQVAELQAQISRPPL